MKNPLHYQVSEFDCGPTTVLNALSYLFQRENLPAELVRNIMIYCLDCYNEEGRPGGNGTSRAAMMFLSNWLNGFGKVSKLPVSSRYLSGKSVYMGQESQINDALRRGGVAVVRLYYDEEHYVLLTGIEDKRILMFDPYYEPEPFEEYPDIEVDQDHPFSYNRKVPEAYFNKENLSFYAFGPYELREAVLLFNDRTTLTSEHTIEYFI